jgi:hypothetical protein
VPGREILELTPWKVLLPFDVGKGPVVLCNLSETEKQIYEQARSNVQKNDCMTIDCMEEMWSWKNWCQTTTVLERTFVLSLLGQLNRIESIRY